MVLFEKFFKPRSRNSKWQDAEPGARRQALVAFRSDSERLAFIHKEPLAELRAQAIAQLESATSLEELLHSHQDDVRQQARQILLSQLLPAGQSIDSISDSTVLVKIAALTADNDLRVLAISRISDEQERLQLAMEHPAARVRQAAAEGIHQPEKLQILLDHAQGKDKTLYRLAKDRLAEQRAQQQQYQAQLDAVQQLLEQTRYLNKVGYHPEFHGKLQLLSQQWPELRQYAQPEQQSAIEQELTSAQAVLDQHAEEEARQQEQHQAEQSAAALQQTLLDELLKLTEHATEATAADLQQALKMLEQSWGQAFRQHKPAAEQTHTFENQLQELFRLQSVLAHYEAHKDALLSWLQTPVADEPERLKAAQRQVSQWRKDLNWPGTFSAPEWFRQLRQRQQLIEEKLQQLHTRQKSRIQEVSQQLQALSAALNDGLLKDAGRLSNRIQQGLRQLDEHSGAGLQREFRTLSARLQEMRDWAGFATAPKKEALADAMEALVNADMAPDLLAEKIHTLQEEWKALGTAPGDAGLWERFKSAGDQAFEPCRAYFAQVAEQRERNIGLREQLIAELHSYEQSMDWASADWKIVQKTLDTARETFRQYSPVERSAHKRTQDAFHEACDLIYAHLKNEYERNLASKQSIVDDAATLAAADDLSQAADQVKALQARWKAVGVTPRNADQKLWQTFRSHCDQVFNRLNENRAARKAELNETVGAAESLVAQARELVQSGAELAAISSGLDDIRQQFAAINLPRTAHQRLSKALSDTGQQLQQRRQEKQQQAEQARWEGLILRLQNLHGDDSAWQNAATQALPQGYDETLFEQARSGSLPRQESSRDLCIMMEILADAESPQADKARRMELQVQRLAEGLGKGLTAEQERQQLVQRWLASDASDTLNGRFVSALKTAL